MTRLIGSVHLSVGGSILVSAVTHPNVHFHFIPTRSSWLNQVECWFSILSRSALQGSSFTSVRMLVQAIEAFIGSWNQHAAPFEWTKREVHQQEMKRSYAELCN
jgi:transposase